MLFEYKGDKRFDESIEKEVYPLVIEWRVCDKMDTRYSNHNIVLK